jgi:hypothetical protein
VSHASCHLPDGEKGEGERFHSQQKSRLLSTTILVSVSPVLRCSPPSTNYLNQDTFRLGSLPESCHHPRTSPQSSILDLPHHKSQSYRYVGLKSNGKQLEYSLHTFRSFSCQIRHLFAQIDGLWSHAPCEFNSEEMQARTGCGLYPRCPRASNTL